MGCPPKSSCLFHKAKYKALSAFPRVPIVNSLIIVKSPGMFVGGKRSPYSVSKYMQELSPLLSCWCGPWYTVGANKCWPEGIKQEYSSEAPPMVLQMVLPCNPVCWVISLLIPNRNIPHVLRDCFSFPGATIPHPCLISIPVENSIFSKQLSHSIFRHGSQSQGHLQ